MNSEMNDNDSINDDDLYYNLQEHQQKKQKQQNSSDDEQPQDKKSQHRQKNLLNQFPSKTNKSNYSQQSTYQKYNQILNQSTLNIRTKSQMIQQLKKYCILYKKQLDTQSQIKNTNNHLNNQKQKQSSISYSLNITKMTHTINYQIVTLTVQLGPFQLQLTILNVFKQSFIYRLAPLTFQDSTNIYLIKQKDQQQICKLVMYNDYSHGQVQTDLRKEEIVYCIREYCISKIMSALKIGPQILKSCQFDLIVSDSGMEFYLQKCIGHTEQGFNKQDEIILKTGLKQMHQLGFLHRDIKPGNIMYSFQYKKYVFIDFGISEYRRQKAGQLILSRFLGTVMYCTQEMRRLLNSRESAWIDAHYNDAYGLEISVRQMQKVIQFQKNLEVNERKILEPQMSSQKKFNHSMNPHNSSVCNQIIFQPQILQRQIKYKLYKNQLQQLISPYKNVMLSLKNRPLEFQRKILNFLYEIPATESIRRFYMSQFNDEIKQQNEFIKLWQCFKTPVYIESYKGERVFLSLKQKKSSEIFMTIYSKMKAKYYNVVNNSKIVKREYEELLKNCDISKEKEGNNFIYEQKFVTSGLNRKVLSLRQYQKFLVDYVSFKNIKLHVTLKQKAHYCMVYAKLLNLENLTQCEEGDQRLLIQKVLHSIIISFSEQKSTPSHNFWHTLVSCIQNYFIVGHKLQINLPNFIKLFLYPVFIDFQLTNFQKIARAIQLLNTRKYLLRKHRNLIQYYNSAQLQDIIQNQIQQFILQEQKYNNNKHLEILQFFQQTFCLYKIQKSKDLYPYAVKNLNNLLYLRQKYLQCKRIFDLVEFQIGIYFQRNDFMEQGRMIHEQKKYEMVVNEDELNHLHFQMILVYEQTLQIKKMKKYLTIVDTAINCPEISEVYFLQIRIFLAFYFYQYKEADILLKRLKTFSLEDMNQFNALQNYQWAKKLNSFDLVKQVKLSESFWEFLQWTEKQVLEFTNNFQEKCNRVTLRHSKNLLHINLLHNSILIQKGLMSNNLRNRNFKEWQPFSEKIQQSQYFNKLIQIKEKGNLTFQEQSFMIYYELYLLKNNKEYGRMLQYLIQKKGVIDNILGKTTRFQKSLLNLTFTLAVWAISKFSTKEKLQQLMLFLIPILNDPRMGCLFYVQDFQHKIMEGLIKTDNFDFIMGKLMAATKYFSRHVSNSNIPSICRFYSNMAGTILFYYKEQHCVKRLKYIISELNPRQNSIFGIFLLFFIYPCNRRKIIQYLYKCLDYINHTGKQIILCRLYKQLYKLKNVTRSRRRYLIKKDLIYPSRFTVNLKDIKNKLNMNGQLDGFKDVFLQQLQNKLVKLGKCCEIYQEFQTQHQINRIFNQIQLDMPLREGIYEEWQKEIW